MSRGVPGATRPRRCRPTRVDTGAVTAELAVALPAVALVLAVLLLTASAGAAQMRCVDAARTAARMLAVGHDPAEARAAATRVAGAEVSMAVQEQGGWIEVTVDRRLGGAWFSAGPLDLSARATARAEP